MSTPIEDQPMTDAAPASPVLTLEMFQQALDASLGVFRKEMNTNMDIINKRLDELEEKEKDNSLINQQEGDAINLENTEILKEEKEIADIQAKEEELLGFDNELKGDVNELQGHFERLENELFEKALTKAEFKELAVSKNEMLDIKLAIENLDKKLDTVTAAANTPVVDRVTLIEQCLRKYLPDVYFESKLRERGRNTIPKTEMQQTAYVKALQDNVLLDTDSDEERLRKFLKIQNFLVHFGDSIPVTLDSLPGHALSESLLRKYKGNNYNSFILFIFQNFNFERYEEKVYSKVIHFTDTYPRTSETTMRKFFGDWIAMAENAPFLKEAAALFIKIALKRAIFIAKLNVDDVLLLNATTLNDIKYIVHTRLGQFRMPEISSPVAKPNEPTPVSFNAIQNKAPLKYSNNFSKTKRTYHWCRKCNCQDCKVAAKRYFDYKRKNNYKSNGRTYNKAFNLITESFNNDEFFESNECPNVLKTKRMTKKKINKLKSTI